MTERNMRIEDLNCENDAPDTSSNIYEYQQEYANTEEARLPRWEESDPKIFGTIQGLLSEKDKIEKDTQKIKQNPKLLPRDKMRMLKSARNLS